MMAEPAQHHRQRQRLADGHDGVVNPARLDLPEHERNVELQRAEAVAGRKAVADVVAENQFHRRAAGFVDFLGFTLDNQARRNFCSARRHELAIDFHQTNEARGERPAFFQVAKRRDVEPRAARRLEDGFAGCDVHGLPVDGDNASVHCGAKLEIRNSKVEGNPKSEN